MPNRKGMPQLGKYFMTPDLMKSDLGADSADKTKKNLSKIPMATAEMTMTTKKKHIFILSGQSNMSGRGGVKHRVWDGVVPDHCGPHPAILRLTSGSQWEEAREPLHRDIDASKTCGVGPAMAFANAIMKSGSMNIGEDVAVGLVPCAVGGTAMKEWEKGSRLYEEMVRRAREAAEVGGEIKGLLWFQGESDTLCDESAEAYRGNMERLIADVRSDLNLPSLPFVQVAIASGEERLMEKLREAQLGIQLPNVVCVDAKGLPLNEDNLHLSTQAQVLLGHMLAEAYIKHFTNKLTD